MGVSRALRDRDRPEAWAPAEGSPAVLDGVFWIARTGSPWRDLPESFVYAATDVVIHFSA